MKIDWNELEIDNEEARSKTIQQCKAQYQKQVKRQEHHPIRLFQRYLDVEGLRIWKGYAVFLLVFIILLQASSVDRALLFTIYFGTMGGYFIYQVMKYRETGFQELLYTMPMNGAKLFLYQMFSFLMLFFMTFGLYITIGEGLREQTMFEIFCEMFFPLCMSQAILLMVLSKIRSYQEALSIYTVVFILITYLTNDAPIPQYHFSKQFQIILEHSLGRFLFVLLSLLLLIVACYMYYRQLGKEQFYEIKC